MSAGVREQFRRRGREEGIRDEEKEEEGFCEWLQAATSLRDFFSPRA